MIHNIFLNKKAWLENQAFKTVYSYWKEKPSKFKLLAESAISRLDV